jgi:nicotinate-nucleotide pyrophosphorylase (carboxylating)
MKPVPRHLLRRLAAEALLEDLGPGDATTTAVIPAGLRARGEILARRPLVASGVDVAAACFLILDPEAEIVFAAREGDAVAAGGRLLEVKGRARALLSAERAALNFLGRLGGIATLTRRYVEAAGTGRAAIFDTRKTTPGMRALEKRAVAAGGGANHRSGLWDAVLIKDNHVDLAGGIGRAVARAREGTGGRLPVEVEVRSLAELREALEAGADAVLLDNFTPRALAEAVSAARGRALVEVSGGVGLDSVREIAALGVDRISVGALTHSAPAADLTMRITTWTT